MKTVGAFALFLLLAIAWTWPARGWPMVFDDLHLVRTFSGSELAAAWTGHWDPDGLETPGFRPLSLAFNHARAALFGEKVIGHRHALAALFALELALLVPLGRALGLGFGASIAAGLVMLFTRYSAYHLVWITDGNHHVQGLAFVGAALLLVAGLARSSRAFLAASKPPTPTGSKACTTARAKPAKSRPRGWAAGTTARRQASSATASTPRPAVYSAARRRGPRANAINTRAGSAASVSSRTQSPSAMARTEAASIAREGRSRPRTSRSADPRKASPWR